MMILQSKSSLMKVRCTCDRPTPSTRTLRTLVLLIVCQIEMMIEAMFLTSKQAFLGRGKIKILAGVNF
jgi:hypothetical protein